MSSPVESSFLPLKADQDFPLPAFPDALDPHGREVDSHPVLEAWTEKSVQVRVRRPTHAAVLVDGDDALRSAGGAAERLLHGVTQDAVAERAVEPEDREARSSSRTLLIAPSTSSTRPEGNAEAALTGAFTRWNVWKAYVNPSHWEVPVARWAGEHGERLLIWPTVRAAKMAAAVRAFDHAIRDGHVTHDGSPAFARQVGAAHRRNLGMFDEQGERLWTIGKERPDSPYPITLATAAVLSWTARRDAMAAGIKPVEEQSYRVEWIG